MIKKLLSTSSSCTLDLVIKIEKSTKFYPANAVFVGSIPRGDFPDMESRAPNHTTFRVLDLSGNIVTHYLSPSYKDVMQTIEADREVIAFYIH
jgi:hypothetical protein